MIRIKIEADAEINAVRINGDFFLHPEDSLPEIEKNLVGLSTATDHPAIAQRIHESLLTQKAAFIGVSPEDIAGTLIEALQNPGA